jgi:hypothetical protein
MQRPPRMERPTGVIGRFAKRVCSLSLIPAVCATVLLAAACGCGCGPGRGPGAGPGAASGSAPAERVPAPARVLMVTVSYPPGSEPPGSQPARPVSVTVTGLARVRQVAGLVDGLSLASPGEEWSCPAFTWGVVKLAFRNSASGRTLAAAQFNLSGCPGVVEVSSSRLQESLNISDAFFRQVLRIAGVRAPSAS